MVQNRKKQKKFRFNKQWVMPALVFIVGIVALYYGINDMREYSRAQEEAISQLNAVSYAERIVSDLKEGVSITGALEQIIHDEDGKIAHFYESAAELNKDSIQSIQLAPGGVVTQVYPEEGNEAAKIDVIHDKDRGEISRYSRDHDVTIMQGPIELKQGGVGIAVRNPIYIDNERGESEFWGFSIAIMRVPEIFDKSMDALRNFGYEYRILKTESPFDTQYQEVYNSGKELQDPVSYEFEAGGCAWKLQLMPSVGWGQKGKNTFIMVGILGMVIICLLTVLTAASLALQKERNTFRELSVTDALTGLLNRNGFDLQAELYMKEHPDEPCVGIILDVDDFKFINDVYGHGCGDETLRKVSEAIQEKFDCDAILARYGGDEFGMLLKNCTAEEMAEKIKDFAEKPGSLRYHGRTHKFTISLGYAEYPADVKNTAELLTAADMALYEVKLHSKHGCMAYDSSFQVRSREQLGFALHDISKNLPGAFLIYAAEPGNDRILFANHELIQLVGCKNIDDLMEFSHGHFRNLLHPEEQESIEESIWKQIDDCDDEGNAYVRFRLACKDGSFRRVLNHSRIVDSIHYGRVFYVLLMDCELLQNSYT